MARRQGFHQVEVLHLAIGGKYVVGRDPGHRSPLWPERWPIWREAEVSAWLREILVRSYT